MKPDLLPDYKNIFPVTDRTYKAPNDMAYELSFSPEFFIGPNDLEMTSEDVEALRAGEIHPVSVWQALIGLSEANWGDACKAAGLDPKFTEVGMLLEHVQKINTCSNLNSPVSVWLDKEGWETIQVYDKPEIE